VTSDEVRVTEVNSVDQLINFGNVRAVPALPPVRLPH
jgi:hypothetical protein